MAIIFPPEFVPTFSEIPADETLKAIFDEVVAGQAFINPLQGLINVLVNAITNSNSTINTIITVLDGYVITPPLPWDLGTGPAGSGTEQDIQDIIDVLTDQTKENLNDLQSLLSGSFQSHTDRLSGVTINNGSLEQSDMMILHAVAIAWMVVLHTHGDKSNKIPQMFGSLFTADDTIRTAIAASGLVGKNISDIDIIGKIEDDLETSISMISDIQSITGVSPNIAALNTHITDDNNTFSTAMNYIRANVTASSITGFAKDDFTRFFFKEVIGSATLVPLIETIPITS